MGNSSFLKELARAQPIPGGGAAAAFGAGLGLALLIKILRLELSRRPEDEARTQFWQGLLDRAENLRRVFNLLRRADGRPT